MGYVIQKTNIIEKITEISPDTEYHTTKLVTIGFGGLHLLKCVTNGTRNNSLPSNGHNFGIHILRVMMNTSGTHTANLNEVKTAVFIGKDCQSDYLYYMTSSKNSRSLEDIKILQLSGYQNQFCLTLIMQNTRKKNDADWY